jgi:hypothetical protein
MTCPVPAQWSLVCGGALIPAVAESIVQDLRITLAWATPATVMGFC